MISLSQLFINISSDIVKYRLGTAMLLSAGRRKSEFGIGIGARSNNGFTIYIDSFQKEEKYNTTVSTSMRIKYQVANAYW